MKDHDVRVLFGDLNFRIGLDPVSIKTLTEEANYGELVRHDEFCAHANKHQLLKAMQEGDLHFDPTYKYDA